MLINGEKILFINLKNLKNNARKKTFEKESYHHVNRKRVNVKIY